MNLVDITNVINSYLWSVAMIGLCLGVGIFFSIRLGFFQIRLIKDMVKHLLGGESSDNGISSFQGFSMALGGRIGVGNIAGVATAICFGGPGAVFWMWVYAFLGAGAAFAESVLAQTWKQEIDGEYRGGPAYYIEKGTGIKALAILFAIAGVIANAFTGPTIQAFNIAEATKNAFGVPALASGIVVAAIFAIIIFGGVKRIGSFAEKVVPVMAGVYILLMFIILAVNIKNVPSMFALIFKSAFNMEAVFGAIWGQTIMWGVKRAVYSSEAGMGSGAQASAAAEVSHPAKQGLAQSFSVYCDTLFVCTATALMVLSTGMYNVAGPKEGTFIIQNLPGVDAGTGYTQAAIDTLIPGLGPAFIAVAIFFFAFTTILSFGFYADCNIAFLFRKNKHLKQIQVAIKLLLTAMIVFGSVKSSAVAWNLADVGVGFMAWVNLIALILLYKPVIKILKDYEYQKKLGIDPVFEPEKLGIKNAELWSDIVKRRYAALLEQKKKIMGEKDQNVAS
ncbi:alanine/glycine:cation symporter family protein [Aminipila terrae]|uniref:Amino acid carrier protein n=1 Tax=Aminipila terrae TaxID=2697030 RepID=A0A6P1MJA1_9FIRM|nr:alanine/glycine:cation symporter family protein [Aminipila terrae]QHI73273.1 amino acid carrier protein [Aminipila terrae]